MSDIARILSLSPQARKVLDHMEKAGSISAREVMADYGITSATLARRICDIEAAGFKIKREQREHPIHNRRYTRYSVVIDAPPTEEIKVGDKVRVTDAFPNALMVGKFGVVIEHFDDGDEWPYEVVIDGGGPTYMAREEIELVKQEG